MGVEVKVGPPSIEVGVMGIAVSPVQGQRIALWMKRGEFAAAFTYLLIKDSSKKCQIIS